MYKILTDEKKLKNRKIFSLILLSLIFLFSIRAFLNFHYYKSYKDESIKSFKDNFYSENSKMVDQIDQNFSNIVKESKSISENLSTNKMDETAAIKALKKIARKNIDIFGIAILLNPKNSPDHKIYTNYQAKNLTNKKLYNSSEIVEGKEFTRVYLEKIYDYTQIKADWYDVPIAENRAFWSEPYYGLGLKTYFISYTEPFYIPNKPKTAENIKGLILFDYAIDNVKQLLDNSNIGKEGYAFVTSKSGKFVTHPLKEYVSNGKTIFDYAKEIKNPDFQTAVKNISSGTDKRGVIPFNAQNSSESGWVCYQKILVSGWTIWSVLLNDEIILDSGLLKSRLINMIIDILIVVLLISLLILAYIFTNIKFIWALSIFTSLSIICGIFTILNISNDTSFSDYGNVQKIKSKVTLQKIINETNLKNSKITKGKQVITIPTGITIDHLNIYENEQKSTLSGFIWQKYNLKENANITRDIYFGNIIGLTTITPMFSKVENDTETIIWNFNTIIGQKFEYKKYPFENRNISIAILPKNLTKDGEMANVMLVPDIDNYPKMTPNLLPGIRAEITAQGLEKRLSFFNYNTENFYTPQLKYNSPVATYPELSFDIVLSRNIANGIIGYMIPILVMAISLFTIMLVLKKDQITGKLETAIDFGFLGVTSALFFSIIVSHIDLRRNLVLNSVIYLEYLYFIIYFLIILIMINSFLFKKSKYLALVHYKNNLIPKLLFWPLVSALFFAATLYFFK